MSWFESVISSVVIEMVFNGWQQEEWTFNESYSFVGQLYSANLWRP